MAQIFRVERTKNFTVMSNHHFKNKNLTFQVSSTISSYSYLDFMALFYPILYILPTVILIFNV